MDLIQLLLPLYNNQRQNFPTDLYDQVRGELMEQFGGVTTHMRAPATGLWKEDSSHTVRDKRVIYEVLADNLDREWWQYRAKLEKRFEQESLIIHATAIERL